MDRGLADLLGQDHEAQAGATPTPGVVAPADPFAQVPDELRGLTHG